MVGVLVLTIAAGIAYFARGTTGTEAEDSACTLSVPAELAVDGPSLSFTATKVCTGDAPDDVTWTATVGTTRTSELRFSRSDSADTDVYSADPFGRWTWKVTKTDQPDITYNEPVTEVRSRSEVTVVAAQLPNAGTRVTFRVRRYDAATGKMAPWVKAPGRIESRNVPAAEGAPFNPAAAVTSDSRGHVVLTLRPGVDQQFRVKFSAVADTFGSTSDHVYVGKAG